MNPGAQNGIVGDGAFGTDIPQSTPIEGASDEIKNAAKFSKSKEFEALKEHLNQRIEFYQMYLPDGTPLASIKNLGERQEGWIVANAIIGEFKAVINAYEQAAQIIKDEQSR